MPGLKLLACRYIHPQLKKMDLGGFGKNFGKMEMGSEEFIAIDPRGLLKEIPNWPKPRSRAEILCPQ